MKPAGTLTGPADHRPASPDRGNARPASPPEALRRRVLHMNTLIALAACMIAAPVAIFLLLTGGVLLAFAATAIGFALVFAALDQQRRRRYETVVAIQTYGMMAIGAILTVAQPAIADLGLATALLGPVHASLLGGRKTSRNVWFAMVGVVALAAISSLKVWSNPLTDFSGPVNWLAAYAFLSVGSIVAHSANRLNTVFEVYEKSQINIFRHLIEHVQDAVIRFSAEGDVLFVSRSSQTLFGAQRFELSSRGIVERVHILDRPAYMTAIAHCNNDGLAATVELRLRYDDPTAPAGPASYTWTEVALSPVIDPDAPHGPHEVLALVRDITVRKDRELEMHAARRAAEEASNAKSRFLAVIGHELRTPLNAIVGFSDMMASSIGGELSQVHKEYAGHIGQSGQHLLAIVNMLLDMSRIEAGKFELQTEAFEPGSLVSPSLQMVDVLARDKKVVLSADISRHLPVIVGDERAIRQIVINLLSNAVKFSNENGEVVLGMKRQGQYLNISIRDNGIGMTPDVVERIGEPFFQAQDGIARDHEGAGLGLSIVNGLVELHDGQLHTVSEFGAGTTMTVLLPLNGPATKSDDTPTVTQLITETDNGQLQTWHERKTAAQ